MPSKAAAPGLVAKGRCEARGHCYQVRKRFGRHLAHDLTSVRRHRDLADPEFATDMLVQLVAIGIDAKVSPIPSSNRRGVMGLVSYVIEEATRPCRPYYESLAALKKSPVSREPRGLVAHTS